MSAPLQTLAKCGVPLLVTGPHAFHAHSSPDDAVFNDCECAIAADDETKLADYFTRNEWNIVYRTPFFAKFRLLSTGTPVIKVLFLDPTTFGQLLAGSFERAFGEITVRIPSLIHVIAMRLQSLKNEPNREIEDLPDILTLLRANKGRWKADELDAVCKRFGPRGIYIRIAQRLAA